MTVPILNSINSNLYLGMTSLSKTDKIKSSHCPPPLWGPSETSPISNSPNKPVPFSVAPKSPVLPIYNFHNNKPLSINPNPNPESPMSNFPPIRESSAKISSFPKLLTNKPKNILIKSSIVFLINNPCKIMSVISSNLTKYFKIFHFMTTLIFFNKSNFLLCKELTWKPLTWLKEDLQEINSNKMFQNYLITFIFWLKFTRKLTIFMLTLKMCILMKNFIWQISSINKPHPLKWFWQLYNGSLKAITMSMKWCNKDFWKYPLKIRKLYKNVSSEETNFKTHPLSLCISGNFGKTLSIAK